MEKHKCGKSCLEFRDIDDNFILLQSKIRKARKDYECIECEDKIPKGSTYERVNVREGDFYYNGDFHTFCTCMRCVSIREELFGTWRFPYENGNDPDDYVIGTLACYVAEDKDLLRKHSAFVQKCFGSEIDVEAWLRPLPCSPVCLAPLAPPSNLRAAPPRKNLW